jgi:hypothetical protein
MHVQAFSCNAVLLLHAYMHGAGASSLGDSAQKWRVRWTARRAQGVRGSATTFVFQPEITDRDHGKLMCVRACDLGDLKWVCEWLVLLSWQQVCFL